MITTNSVTDGFSVILGTYITHLAAFLTLLLVVQKPPEYESEERNQLAKVSFFCMLS